MFRKNSYFKEKYNFYKNEQKKMMKEKMSMQNIIFPWSVKSRNDSIEISEKIKFCEKIWMSIEQN